MKSGAAILAIYVVSASVGLAQEAAGVSVTYSMNMVGSRVKGSMTVARLVDGEAQPQGYALKRVVEFITEDCASGKVGPIKLGAKRVQNGEGIVRQKFKTTCIGGPHRRIGATSTARVTIERQDDGRDLAEYHYDKDGDMQTSQRYR